LLAVTGQEKGMAREGKKWGFGSRRKISQKQGRKGQEKLVVVLAHLSHFSLLTRPLFSFVCNGFWAGWLSLKVLLFQKIHNCAVWVTETENKSLVSPQLFPT
jgi:hypothetical protein